MKMKIVIKIGSAVLMKNGRRGINQKVLSNIVEQIAVLKEEAKDDVVVVTSGAVASCQEKYYSESLRAAIGQPRIMGLYSREFEEYAIQSAQLLLTHEDLEKPRCENVINLLCEALENGVVPIINANDSVSSEELNALRQFADNDVLAGEIASLIDADLLIILMKEKGLIDFEKEKVVHMVGNLYNYKRFLKIERLAKGKNRHGKGGMLSKINIARRLTCEFPVSREHGIEVRLLPGRQENVILSSLAGKRIGTIFKSYKKY